MCPNGLCDSGLTKAKSCTEIPARRVCRERAHRSLPLFHSCTLVCGSLSADHTKTIRLHLAHSPISESLDKLPVQSVSRGINALLVLWTFSINGLQPVEPRWLQKTSLNLFGLATRQISFQAQYTVSDTKAEKKGCSIRIHHKSTSTACSRQILRVPPSGSRQAPLPGSYK